jgi:hypothetical protein
MESEKMESKIAKYLDAFNKKLIIPKKITKEDYNNKFKNINTDYIKSEDGEYYYLRNNLKVENIETIYKKLPEDYKNEYIQKTGLSNIKGQIIFRGQDNYKWSIMSSAGRRLSKDNHNKQDDFITYHVNLIENARKYGYGKLEAGSNLSDLEMLAEIQHRGGATCLIDFSTNILIALWMATEEKYKNETILNSNGKINNNGSDEKVDGKIFWIDLGNEINQSNIMYYNEDKKDNENNKIHRILRNIRINQELKREKVEPTYWLWNPTKLNNRIIMQDSVFLFGLAAFPEYYKQIRMVYDEMIIENGDKAQLRKELELLFGINAETVYYDLSGFSLNANNQNVKISDRILPDKNCLYNAKECIKNSQFSQAISYLNDSYSCKKDNNNKCKKGKTPCENNSLGEILFWKAKVCYERKEIGRALLNFSEAAEKLEEENCLQAEKKNYYLLCETYRMLSIINYSKFEYENALKADSELKKIYEKYNCDNSKDLNGVDSFFALIELNIFLFNIDKAKNLIDETRTKLAKIFASDNKKYTYINNSNILLCFLENLYLCLKECKKIEKNIHKHNQSSDNIKNNDIKINESILKKYFDDIDKILKDIFIKLDQNKEDEKELNKNKISLIGYFNWDYSDAIKWVEKIKEKEKKDTMHEIVYKNAEKIILMAEKAEDIQSKLLNKVFSESISVSSNIPDKIEENVFDELNNDKNTGIKEILSFFYKKEENKKEKNYYYLLKKENDIIKDGYKNNIENYYNAKKQISEIIEKYKKEQENKEENQPKEIIAPALEEGEENSHLN